jgi:thiol-disulfide isomerase/thioredoxin
MRGHPVLLVSWATWCTQCRAELPALQRYFEQYKMDPLQIVLVNVNSSESRKEIDDMIRRYHLSMIEWRDRDNEFGSRFRTVGVPTAVLLDRAGKVVKIWPGAINPNGAELARALREMR